MLVGALVALIRWRWPSRSMTLIWFGSTLLMAWTLTENPPSSQRGLLLMPAVALFVGWGVSALWDIFARQRAVLYGVLGALSLMMVLLNLGFYFEVYTPRRTYGNPTAEKATEFARFALEHPLPQCSFPADDCGAMTYFLGAPELYWNFGTFAFLLRDQSGMDVLPGEKPLDVKAPARFVVLPARATELETIRFNYPGGILTHITTADGRLMALVYDWGITGLP